MASRGKGRDYRLSSISYYVFLNANIFKQGSYITSYTEEEIVFRNKEVSKC
jgi:hypothetical protein